MDIFSQHLTTNTLTEERARPAAVAPSPREPLSDDGGHLEAMRRRFPGQSWLTVPQVAACLQLSPGHIYNQHCAGQLPFEVRKTVSGRLRVSVQVLAAYMNSQRVLAQQGARPVRGPRLRWMRLPSQPAAFQEQ